jgi:phenylalanine-4-hydroxylase
MQTTDVQQAAFRTAQDWDSYDAGQHDVWRILYERRMRALLHTGSRIFLSGAERIGLSSEQVPDLRDINARLAGLTGWQAIAVTGFIPAHEFFACLARREFPTTITVRPREQLDYLPEPDIFHDVFGHVPLHADPVFADFLQHFGSVAARAGTDEETAWMARLFWFTVEFGLVREDGDVRVYGSGLISSHADAAHALHPARDRRPFRLDDVIAQEFRIDRVQDTLFVVDDFAQLFDAVETMNRRIGIP